MQVCSPQLFLNMSLILNFMIRCPNGFIKTNDGKYCKTIDECTEDQCMKDERPCRLTSSSKHCSCADNSSDCKENGAKLSNNFNTIAFSTIIVCLLNIPRQLSSLFQPFLEFH